MIYLDYAATTPVDRRVLKAMFPFFDKKFGNASSLHSAGQIAREAVEKSRRTIAKNLNCQSEEIIFTSGATESNNLAIKGIFKALQAVKNTPKLHFLTSQIEHHCVLDSLEALEKEYPAKIEVTYLEVDKEGRVDPKKLKENLRPNTVLVSIMFVNNEIGTVEPLAEIGKVIKAQKNKRSPQDLPLYFHSDATQAPSYFDCDMQKLGLDLITLSAHKIYGPKGAGLLAAKKNVRLAAIQHGGGHENNRRSGTLNVPGIVGLGKAVEIAAKERQENSKKITALRDRFIKKIEKEIKEAKLNGSRKNRTPNNANFSFSGAEGESIVLLLDQEGIAVSTGSACSSENLEPSHVQLAIGNSHLKAHSSIRFTLGKHSTQKELDTTVLKLKKVLKKLRAISQKISL